jgi:predicted transcriptional regulator
MTENVHDKPELTYSKRNIELRRDKILALSSRGMSQQSIADQLGVSQAVVSLDLQYLSCKAQENLKDHIEQRIPTQYQRCEVGLNQVLEKLWEIAESTHDNKEKIQSYGLITNTYKCILDLSTDGATIQSAMKWIAKKKAELVKPSEQEENEQIDNLQQQEESEEEASESASEEEVS